MKKEDLKNTKIWVGDSTLEEKKKVQQFIGENINKFYTNNKLDGLTCYFINEKLDVTWDLYDRGKFISTSITHKELTPYELLGEQKDKLIPDTEIDFYIALERIKLLKERINTDKTELNELIDKLKTL